MKYQLAPFGCRPWLLNGLSLRLIESHYENNYGGALRRLNAITEKLETLDYASAPPYIVNGLKRDELVALNSTLEVNCALLIDRLAGLRNMEGFVSSEAAPAGAPDYFGSGYTDAGGAFWQEINLQALSQQPQFLSISA